MDSNITRLVFKNRAKLIKLIEQNAPYEQILEQSRVLDKYIVEQMKYINENRSKL